MASRAGLRASTTGRSEPSRVGQSVVRCCVCSSRCAQCVQRLSQGKELKSLDRNSLRSILACCNCRGSCWPTSKVTSFPERPPIGIRRRLQSRQTAPVKPFTLPMRILFVVSRPEGAGFLDPRSSAQALFDAIEPLGDQVVVEFLYPPTLKALTQRVRDQALPPVHVVHFDGHGVYVPQTGLGYLLFENDAHEEQLVNADDLGTLLNDTGVPLMILDACQTAQADKANPFGSVASKLIEAGVGSVLAMNYSVFVEATRLLTAAFYGALAVGNTIGQAVDAARFAHVDGAGALQVVSQRERGSDPATRLVPACAVPTVN